MNLAMFQIFLIDFGIIVLWITLLVQLTSLIDRFGQTIFPGIGYRVLLAPGVILHELSHAFLCLLTGAKVTKISVFERTGGSVTHGPAKIYFGQALISWAPLPCLMIVIYVLLRYFIDINGDFWVRNHWVGFDGMLKAQWASLKEMFNFFSTGLNWSLKNVVLSYVVISCIACMSPSKTDLENSWKPSFALLAVYFVVELIVQWVFGRPLLQSLIHPISPAITFSLTMILLLLAVMWPLSFVMGLIFKK